MISLHQYPPVWGLPSLSPFCIKVETYLRMANLPYQVVRERNPRKGPKGKMPVLYDDGKGIPDSSFIIEYLENKYSIRMDHDLSQEKRALAHTIKIMIEEHLYFVLLYSRWIDPLGKETINKEFRQFFPKLISGFVLKWISSNLNKQAYQQGIGRHSQEEIYHLGRKNITALSDLMGKNLYVLTDKPHTIDATVYAFLVTILASPFESPLKKCVKEHANLVSYCDRMKNEFFKN